MALASRSPASPTVAQTRPGSRDRRASRGTNSGGRQACHIGSPRGSGSVCRTPLGFARAVYYSAGVGEVEKKWLAGLGRWYGPPREAQPSPNPPRTPHDGVPKRGRARLFRRAATTRFAGNADFSGRMLLDAPPVARRNRYEKTLATLRSANVTPDAPLPSCSPLAVFARHTNLPGKKAVATGARFASGLGAACSPPVSPSRAASCRDGSC